MLQALEPDEVGKASPWEPKLVERRWIAPPPGTRATERPPAIPAHGPSAKSRACAALHGPGPWGRTLLDISKPPG